MNDRAFASRLRELLRERDAVERLLLREKERRGLTTDSLVFVGMANIASYYWCAMRAILRSRIKEPAFFSAYVSDRLAYSHQLGLIDKLPEDHDTLLGVGSEITLEDIQRLLMERAERTRGASITSSVVEFTDDNGARAMVINPDLPSDERSRYEKEARDRGVRIAALEEFPELRGELLETTRAEQYPTIRWNFEWSRYVVVGVPDGITDTFAYEFKTTRNNFLKGFEKPVALAQGDLYGHFFQRGEKRVQIHVLETGETTTWQVNVDQSAAKKLLGSFKRVDGGWAPPRPKGWKCRRCEFNSECPLVETA